MDFMQNNSKDGVDKSMELKAKFGISTIYNSSHTDEATLKRVKGTSPYGYILKPFKRENIHTTIEVATEIIR